MKIILQKFIAQSGFCSRRKAEEMIRRGQVKVDDCLARLGDAVSGVEDIRAGGRKIGLPEEKIYIKLNKPKGYVCTNRSFRGEKNIFSLVKKGERLFVVGRLDKDSRGLVLLTNDGDLAQKVSHPSFQHEKEYLAQCQISNDKLQIISEMDGEKIAERLKQGVDIGEGDGIVWAKQAEYLGNNRFKIILTQGKKRQARRMFKALGMEVADLSRIRIGDVRLGVLPEGKWEEMRDWRLEIRD